MYIVENLKKINRKEEKNHYFGAFLSSLLLYTYMYTLVPSYAYYLFSVKGQKVNVFSFAGDMVSVATTQLFLVVQKQM